MSFLCKNKRQCLIPYTASLINTSLILSDLFVDLDNLFSIQVTAVLADRAAKHLSMTLGTFNETRHVKFPCASVTCSPCLRPFTLRMCHSSSPLSFHKCLKIIPYISSFCKSLFIEKIFLIGSPLSGSSV